MIGFLRGSVAILGEDHVVLDVGGVGYRAWVPHSTRVRLPEVGLEVFLWTSLQVREDAVTLYGFKDEDEYRLFELLLSVSGVGPKLGLTILSSVTPDTFRLAVAREDVTLLTKVPGVGKKTAQRLCLELKDKVGEIPVSAGATVAASLKLTPEVQDEMGEASEALSALGYTRAEISRALEQARPLLEDRAPVSTEALVRTALRLLSRRA